MLPGWPVRPVSARPYLRSSWAVSRRGAFQRESRRVVCCSGLTSPGRRATGDNDVIAGTNTLTNRPRKRGAASTSLALCALLRPAAPPAKAATGARRVAAVFDPGLRFPECAESAGAALAARLEDLVALPLAGQEGHGAGRRRSRCASSTAATLDALDPAANHVVRLGHSSHLLKLRGKFWLIDPVFGERVSPCQLRRAEALPPAAAGAERAAADRRPDPVARPLRPPRRADHRVPDASACNATSCRWAWARGCWRWACRPSASQEFDWWQGGSHAGVQLTATPAQHFSGRTLYDRNRTLWAAWVIQSGEQRIFYSGDSGYFPGFKQIGERFGGFDLALMENGAYDTYWPAVHMTPEETVQAFHDLRGRTAVLVHNSTFDLAFHTWHDPLDARRRPGGSKGMRAGHARDRRSADGRPAAHQRAVVEGLELRFQGSAPDCRLKSRPSRDSRSRRAAAPCPASSSSPPPCPTPTASSTSATSWSTSRPTSGCGFQRMQGHEVHFVCADDAHGAPIMIAAEKAGKTPQALRGRASPPAASSTSTAFTSASTTGTRTDAPENHELAQDIYRDLRKANGLIASAHHRAVLRPGEEHVPARPLHQGRVPELRRQGPVRRQLRGLRRGLRARPT